VYEQCTKILYSDLMWLFSFRFSTFPKEADPGIDAEAWLDSQVINSILIVTLRHASFYTVQYTHRLPLRENNEFKLERALCHTTIGCVSADGAVLFVHLPATTRLSLTSD
jgi:hypothetical protein